MTKYILVQWPEAQKVNELLTQEEFNEHCYSVVSAAPAYMIPEDIYNKLFKTK